jgi:hypothetical protein
MAPPPGVGMVTAQSEAMRYVTLKFLVHTSVLFTHEVQKKHHVTDSSTRQIGIL